MNKKVNIFHFFIIHARVTLLTTHLGSPREVLMQPKGLSFGPVRHLEGPDVLGLLTGSPTLHHQSLDNSRSDKVDLQMQQVGTCTIF